VRATTGDAADEAVEGEDATDAGANGSEPDADADAPIDLEALEDVEEDAPEVAET
jgi:hypothetical protein